MDKKINVVEQVLRYFLERSLSLKFDICTCERCKAAMMDYLLGKFDPIYVDPLDPRYTEINRDISRQYCQKIFIEVASAINNVSNRMPHPLETNHERDLEELLQKIRQDRGVDFSQYHRSVLKRRLALRLVANKVNSYVEYLRILAASPQEYEELFDVLTINVSYFFRDVPVWMALRRLLQQYIVDCNKRGQPITFWSAACAKGEEPYSLAILCREICPPDLAVPLKICATGIDKVSLEEARSGVYPASKIDQAINDIVRDYFLIDIKKYFTLRGENYHINDEIKKMVDFKYLDLTSKDSISNVDVIFCRNVFIYFTKSLQEQILDKFYRALKPAGYLVTGETENLVYEAMEVFKQIDYNYRIYQKVKA